MKYTFIVEDAHEYGTFKSIQESESVHLADVLYNFENFLKGAGFQIDGGLEIAETDDQSWTSEWNTSIQGSVFDDVEKFMVAAGQNCDLIPSSEETPHAELYKRLIDEEYAEFKEADAAKDDVERLDACFDMIWVIVGYMKSRGWDCDAAWLEGAASNHAKIDSETGICIRRVEDGKILKPEGWQPPNFRKFV